jgi:hypothetical protein
VKVLKWAGSSRNWILNNGHVNLFHVSPYKDIIIRNCDKIDQIFTEKKVCFWILSSKNSKLHKFLQFGSGKFLLKKKAENNLINSEHVKVGIVYIKLK